MEMAFRRTRTPLSDVHSPISTDLCRIRVQDLSSREPFRAPFGEAVDRHSRARGPRSRLQDVELATHEWVWWFNNHRLLGPLSHVPPAESENCSIHGRRLQPSP